MSQIAASGATPRRSARLSQAGSVTGQSVLTTVTPGGTRQRKKGPLTKVKARKSNAYGASGRVGAAEELSISTTGFAKAFQSQRGDAVARDDEEDEEDEDENDVDELGAETPRMSGALNGHGFQRSPSVENRHHQISNISFEETEDIAPSEDGLATSIGNTSKSFGLGHEAGMLSRPTRHFSPQSSPVIDSDPPLWQRNAARRAQLATQTRTTQRTVIESQTIPRPRPEEAPLPQRTPLQQPATTPFAETQARSQVEEASRSRAQHRTPAVPQQTRDPRKVDEWLGNLEAGQQDEADWRWKKYALSAMGLLFLAILSSLVLPNAWSSQSSDATHGASFGTTLKTYIHDTRHGLSRMIRPDDAIIDDENMLKQGLYDFKYDFIKQLKEDLPGYLIVHKNGNRLEIRDEFWQALLNKANSSSDDLWAGFLQSNEEKLRGLLDVPRPATDLGSKPVAVSREEFIAIIENWYKEHAAQVDKRTVEVIKAQTSGIRSISREEVEKAAFQQSLARGNLQANYELNLLKTNYFSPGLGAVIVPTMTSATLSNDTGLFSWVNRKMALHSQRNPPTAALSKWEEPGDCWCSAPNPSMKGQAQLAVHLPQPVLPSQITIEHVPMSMVPAKKIANAPRHVELWVETDQDVRDVYANRRADCKDGPAGWTCLGSFKYNIHASNHVQTFDLDAKTTAPISKAMVRVLSNWGSDHTCLYRVRLHGEPSDDDYQYSVTLNDPVE